MTSVVPQEEMLNEIEEDTRRAWNGYSESLQELSGEAYERAEAEAWERLQRELSLLERRRQAVAG